MRRGQWARAGGWVGWGRGAIDDGQRDCVARGHLLAAEGLQALMAGDAETACATFTEERQIGKRFADQHPITLAGFGQGQAPIAMGRLAEGTGDRHASCEGNSTFRIPTESRVDRQSNVGSTVEVLDFVLACVIVSASLALVRALGGT